MSETREVSAAAAGTFSIGGDMVVNRMGFGAMRITGKGIWGAPDDSDAARELLRQVLAMDVNFIDTADAYGPEVSEYLIAEALYPYPDDVVIATKGGLVREGPNEWPMDGRPEHLRRALNNSLRRLRLERIDLYQFHRPDPDVPFEDSVGELARQREAGKIRHLGLSNVTVEQIEQAMAIVPIATVQNRYNLTDRKSEDVLDWCEAHDVGFIPWFPIGSGTLELAALQQVADQHDATTYQIALAWLLHRSPVMLPIPGTSSVDHLRENVAAAGIELSEEQFALLGE